MARSAGWFPLVGILLGALNCLAVAALRDHLPTSVLAFLLVALDALVTGALHYDGLADTADGFFGAADRVEKLAIMRDSRTGNFGVLALILSVGLRAAALAAIGTGGRVAAALVAGHAVARGFLPLVLRALEPARADGLGAAAGRPEAAIAWLAAGLAVPIALVALDFGTGLVALLAAALVMALGAGVAQRQIGGYTGDVLGALEQGGETVVLLVAAAWAT